MAKKEHLSVRLPKGLMSEVRKFVVEWEEIGIKVSIAEVIEGIMRLGIDDYRRHIKEEEEEYKETNKEERKKNVNDRLRRIIFDHTDDNRRWETR